MCIHWDNSDYCPRCKANREAMAHVVWKESYWHQDKKEKVIGHQQDTDANR